MEYANGGDLEVNACYKVETHREEEKNAELCSGGINLANGKIGSHWLVCVT